MLFAEALKDIRKRVFGKQSVLADHLRVSGAAVSYWETSQKLPSPGSLRRITEDLRHHLTESEIVQLQTLWHSQRENRSTPGAE